MVEKPVYLFLVSSVEVFKPYDRLVGQYAESHLRFDRALEIFQNLDTCYQIGRTLFELGEISVAQSDTHKARDYFARALESFESMQAVTDTARVRSTLETLK